MLYSPKVRINTSDLFFTTSKNKEACIGTAMDGGGSMQPRVSAMLKLVGMSKK